MSDLIEKYSVPRVATGVLVLRDGKVLLSKRWDREGHFVWSMPGGHLEHGETIEQCARRETMEESGIEIRNVRFILAMNQLGALPRHYVLFGLVADWESGEPRNEGSKMTDWAWFSLNELPEPMYRPSELLVDTYQKGDTVIGDENIL